MKTCSVCKKPQKAGNGSFFRVPHDDQRLIWSEICGVIFSRNAIICMDHFAASSFINTGRRLYLVNKAVPVARVKSENEVVDNYNVEIVENSLNSNKMVQLMEKEIIELSDMKSISSSSATQTNTDICGLVQALKLSADEFCINCFYCPEIFQLQEWRNFVKHLKKNHCENELEYCKNAAADHDYTSTALTVSFLKNPNCETDITVETQPPLSVDPLEPENVTIKAEVISPDEIEYTMEISAQQNKARGFKEIGDEELENNESYSIEIFKPKPAEISFEYTPQEIVDFLLDIMKEYPVLWQFHNEPFNEDFYEAIEKLCVKINEKWSLNIDNLKMRRSINRIIRFYCYLYPNTNIENIDQFTCYYDKCAFFLPSTISEVAYARCSQCYICYRNDFDLKSHLLDECKHLQWPHKCLQCKECFRDDDEYEFHMRLPHYKEIFRCEKCNKTFVRRNKFNVHMARSHQSGSSVNQYPCNICGRNYTNNSSLFNHMKYHGERKHKCHLCPKSFFERSKLRVHINGHKQQYDYVCELCGKGVLTQSKLSVHMKSHTREKIRCNICNLELRKSSLSRHLRLLHVAYEGTIETTMKGRHLNYRRLYKSGSFRRKSKFVEKICRCKICSISFQNDTLLAEHNKKIHPDIPKWSCKMCNTDFSQKLSLKRHYRKRHNLHQTQIYKLVEEHEELHAVLAMKKDHLDVLAKKTGPKKKRANFTLTNIETQELPFEFFFEEGQIKCSEDEIGQSEDFLKEI